MGANAMRPPRAVAAIVFDFDGLILDTESAEYDSISHVFAQHGTEFSLELWRSFIGTTDHAHWTDVLRDQVDHPIDVEVVRAERRRHNRQLLAELDVLPGIVDLLDSARAEGIPVAVASSSPRDWVVPHLERIGLLDRFATVCTRDEVARGKPSPDLYQLAVSQLGVDAGHAVAIEDSINGCVAAHAAGLAVVAVPSPFLVGLDFATADLVVGSATELGLDVLSDLAGARS
jgi:HAD superfamily hydrolase (TIGR01509 family)